jgi:hypothetical protein
MIRRLRLSGRTLVGQAGGKLDWAKGPVRKLTHGELFVLGEVQAYWVIRIPSTTSSSRIGATRRSLCALVMVVSH